MAQTTKISGSNKIAKTAKIIQQASNQAKILPILLNKNNPKIMRNIMIRPLIKK